MDKSKTVAGLPGRWGARKSLGERYKAGLAGKKKTKTRKPDSNNRDLTTRTKPKRRKDLTGCWKTGGESGGYPLVWSAEAKLETKLNIHVPSRKKKKKKNRQEMVKCKCIFKKAHTGRKSLEIRVRQNSPDSSCQAWSVACVAERHRCTWVWKLLHKLPCQL